ncbi:hypothetical protein COE58_25815 [Bacillus cereus]|nr:hypothetical protein COE58_25815 [Bacillus cereus]
MDIPSLMNNAHSVITFWNEHYIVLDNGNLYDQEKKREVPIARVFRHIKYARNSHGVLIAKRNHKNSDLKHVKLVKKHKCS